MKPPRFEYERPLTTAAALDVLAARRDQAKVLAGGQSLVPMLNLRLASPACLIDLNAVSELAYVVRELGVLRIGAMTRQAVLERSPLIARYSPLIAEALPNVGHIQIRNRGTVGGSIAHADPAAELPAVLIALGALFHIRSSSGDRIVPACKFFLSPMVTDLRDDELLAEIEIPPIPQRSGCAFREFSRRHGDFAFAGAAVRLELNDDGRCRGAVVVLLGCGPTPRRYEEAEACLIDRSPVKAAEECASAAAESCPARDDADGPASYRRRVTRHLVESAIRVAAARASRMS